MKKIKTRTISILFILSACIILDACNLEAPKGKDQVIIPTDTIFVASDSSQKVILHSLIEVYEALNPTKKVLPIYNREGKLYDYIRTDKVDLIFRSYLLTASELKDIEKRNLIPKINALWTDGLALIAARSFPKDSITEEDLMAVLTNRYSDFHIIIDNSNTATYDLIYAKYTKGQRRINAYASGSEDSVISAVKQHDNYIGLIGSSYFTVKKDLLPKGVKLIGLIPVGHKKAEYPFQDQLYNGVYPLTREIHAINVGPRDGSGSAFASFILSERGQRIILKAGLLPAKIPPRTIELITE